MQSYLLPISDREPLEWILREQRTAFPAYRRADASKLEAGDSLFLYTTRGCFRNPTRDRGRVVGVAVVAQPARDLDEPISFGGREFSVGVDFHINALLPRDRGVELGPLIPKLRDSFPNERAWSARLRRALVPLAARDAATLKRAMERAKPVRREDAVDTYPHAAGSGRSGAVMLP
jgi:hypothetical protein